MQAFLLDSFEKLAVKTLPTVFDIEPVLFAIQNFRIVKLAQIVS